MDSHSPCTLYIVFYLIQYIWSIRIQADEYTCLRKESQFMYRKQTVYSYTGRNSVFMPRIILVLLVLFWEETFLIFNSMYADRTSCKTFVILQCRKPIKGKESRRGSTYPPSLYTLPLSSNTVSFKKREAKKRPIEYGL